MRGMKLKDVPITGWLWSPRTVLESQSTSAEGWLAPEAWLAISPPVLTTEVPLCASHLPSYALTPPRSSSYAHPQPALAGNPGKDAPALSGPVTSEGGHTPQFAWKERIKAWQS